MDSQKITYLSSLGIHQLDDFFAIPSTKFEKFLWKFNKWLFYKKLEIFHGYKF